MIKLMKLLKENPNLVVDADGKAYSWTDKGARSFGIYGGSLYVAIRDSVIHFHLLSGVDRESFQYPGRLWLKDKIISFWEYPPKNELRKVISELEKALKIKMWNKGWKIEVSKDGSKNWGLDTETKDGVLISLEDFTGSKHHKGEDHFKSPVLKQLKNIPKGVGSKKIPKDMKPGETIGQYHLRTRQEGVIK